MVLVPVLQLEPQLEKVANPLIQLNLLILGLVLLHPLLEQSILLFLWPSSKLQKEELTIRIQKFKSLHLGKRDRVGKPLAAAAAASSRAASAVFWTSWEQHWSAPGLDAPDDVVLAVATPGPTRVLCEPIQLRSS